jgi:DNA invertase Pin-like site-specific DNA recombinase
MAAYGYARVGTDGQSLAAQIAELRAAKCAKIFQKKSAVLGRIASS